MAEQQEEDFKSLPLPDRFAHKNWKVRKEGYEDAAKEFDSAQTEADPVVRQFVNDSSLWKAAVTDSNVAAHQEALACLCAFLNIAGPQGCTRTRGVTISPLVEKGLTSTKPAAKAKALEAILLYVELDRPDPVIEELLPLLSHKLAKVVAATLSCFATIFHDFGTKTVDPKPVLKALVKVYGHADKNVRAEGQKLTVELYRWLRDGMKPLFWNDLKEIQQKDLEALFEPVKGEPAPKQERLLRSQQAKAERQAAQAAVEEDVAEGDEVEAEFEPELLAINVFEKIPKDFQERISSSKWKDRKEACDDLFAAVNVPAIEPGSFDDIVRPLAKCMKDANIAVVTIAANCIEALAKGLRRDFAKYKSTVFEPMMERLKERKASVIEALAAGLDAVIGATGLSENLENLLGFTAHKNPQVKLEANRLVTRCLKSTKTAPSIPETKLIADAASKTLTDAQETTRTAGAEVLGVLLKIMGDRIMNTHLDNLDDMRKAKIKEFCDAAEVKAKYKPKAAAAPAPKALGTPASKKPMSRRPAAPAAAKKAAPPPQQRAESPPPELPPKPTARSGGLPRPGAAGASGIGKGIRPPGLAAPGKKLPAPPTASNPGSPRRPARLPTPTEDELPPAAKPPGLGRGLTGRTLSKPNASQAEAPLPAAPPPPAAPAFDAAKEAELEEMRAEVERLRTSNEQLRSDQIKLSSQINELQNQNAQLIEDHTRDVLSIKAKETQLVRARSEAESAEQTSSQLQREVERLKRELARIGRANSPRPESFAASGSEIFPDSNGAANNRSQQRNSGPQSPGGRDGKENMGTFESKRLSPPPARPVSVMIPPMGRKNSNSAGSPARPMSMMYRPQSRAPFAEGVRGNENGGNVSDSDGRSSGASSGAAGAAPSNSMNEYGVENWKRTAEVTQNLRARIEQMRTQAQARQGHLHRG